MSSAPYRLSAKLTLGPDPADILCREAEALQQDRDFTAAIDCYRRAIALRPAFAKAHHDLGTVHHRNHDLDAAIACYRAAMALAPTHAGVHRNLAGALKQQGALAEAMAQYRSALALQPNDAGVLGQIIYLSQRLCDWRCHAADQAALKGAARSGSRDLPMLLRTASPSSAEELVLARLASAPLRDIPCLAAPSGRAGKRRIRIGYLSSDFGLHPVGRLLAPVLEQHDRAGFEPFGYSHGPDDGSAIRRRLQSAFEHFVDLQAMGDAAAAERIQADDIDILVDLNGFTTGERPEIVARRPAPVQVSWLGYTGTMGSDRVDYVIADRFALPMDQQPFYDERIVHLPGSCLPVDPTPVGAAPSRAASGLPPRGFVFCCFSLSHKITPAMFDIWMRLLSRVTGSVLWLAAADAAAGNLRREASQRGVDPSRLVLAPELPLPDYRARFGAADLFLDTLPYSAGAVAGDALAAGLPVLTCAGDIFAGRHAGSLLHAMGLPDLITTSLGDYEALAYRLATGPARLQDLRLRVGAAQAVIDAASFARGLEAAFRQMHETRLAGMPPAAFTVAEPPSSPAVGRSVD